MENGKRRKKVERKQTREGRERRNHFELKGEEKVVKGGREGDGKGVITW